MKEEPLSNPFSAFETGKTIIVKPSAGRAMNSDGLTSPPRNPIQATSAAASLDAFDLPDAPEVAGLNPVLKAAAPLLAMAPALRAMPRHPDPSGLCASLVESIKRFESTVLASGVPNAQVVAARYILCTHLDEAASSTPWGGSGAWAANSLLVRFHNESWGGEKVFQLLSRLGQNPVENRNLLEFIYAALALGFEGRYRVLDNGRAQLDSIRQRLSQMLRTSAVPGELSPQWQIEAPPVRRIRDGIPVWVISAGAALSLVAVFVVMRLSVNAQTDAVFSGLQSLGAQVPVSAAVSSPVPMPEKAPPRLASLLSPDVQARKLDVRDFADRSVVTIQGDGMFSAGSDAVKGDEVMLLTRIGEALAKVPGNITISGHTDSVPIRSLQFPSNWHLSKARALSVRDLLAAQVDPVRMRVEGRADTEPLAENTSADGRARNRRVEIVLTPSVTEVSGAKR
jgi:type VI secretion system protein ImpK